MSLSISLSNAVTGLSAAARGAEVVSSNVSNALTEGYGVRRLQLASRAGGHYGAGVEVIGVERVVDMQVLADRRHADAGSNFADVQLEFQKKIEMAIGIPGEDGSLSDRISAFEGSLISAVSRPDVGARLIGAVNSAKLLAQKFNDMSTEIQTLRQQADAAIEADVNQLNSLLVQIEKMGGEIARRVTSGVDASAQLDQRQLLIDRVSEIVPVKEIDRGRGQIALISPGGGILLDGVAAQFEFSSVGVITPDMTRAAGSLSGLSMNGVEINLDSSTNAIMGGRLAARFAVRDDLAVQEQARVDELALDLVLRFHDPGLDPTLGPFDGGLFTDGRLIFDPTVPFFSEGLSSKLEVNERLDTDRGGEPRRLRDGVNSTTAGEVGDASLLQAMVDVMQEPRSISTAGFSGSERGFSDLSAEFLSLVGTRRQSFEIEVSFASASVSSLKELELRGGVDTDHEMQNLLLVETAYSANARVIQVVDELFATLMEI